MPGPLPDEEPHRTPTARLSDDVVPPGATVIAAGRHWAPNTVIDLFLEPGDYIGSAVVDDNGEWRRAFDIADDAVPGPYTVRVDGFATDGPFSIPLPLTVVVDVGAPGPLPSPTPSPTPTTPPITGGGPTVPVLVPVAAPAPVAPAVGSLPSTGVDAALPALLALTMALLGIVLLRRSRAGSPVAELSGSPSSMGPDSPPD